MLPSAEKCSLAWEDFQENAGETFRGLRADQDFCDVTLVCEDNQQIEAHKVVISASSVLLQKMLRSSQHKKPMLYFWGIKARDLSSVVDFIYNGQVEVYQSDLPVFLEVASMLAIKGLGTESTGNKIQTNKLKSNGQFDPLAENKSPTNSGVKDSNEALKVKNEAVVDIEADELIPEVPVVDTSLAKKIILRKRSPIWRLFDEDNIDPSTVYCKICNKSVSRGKTGTAPSKMSSTPMRVHLKGAHQEQWQQLCLVMEANQQMNQSSNDESSLKLDAEAAQPEPSADDPNKNDFDPLLQPEPGLLHESSKSTRSPVWEMFVLDHKNPATAVCTLCNKLIKRGKPGDPKRKLGNFGMKKHLTSIHPEQWNRFLESKAKTGEREESVKEPKRTKNNVWDFYEVDFDAASAMCQVGDCTASIRNDPSGPWSMEALKGHLYTHGYTD